jgi:lipopolysaccharide export LptBFGC system permease protein LptF
MRIRSSKTEACQYFFSPVPCPVCIFFLSCSIIYVWGENKLTNKQKTTRKKKNKTKKTKQNKNKNKENIRNVENEKSGMTKNRNIISCVKPGPWI